ncbi:pleiotropic regulatory protein RsmS [uncultured Shewanella sp.]|uniref:pleiotropic regulatory protein RsmS n=1 Tax=Shewanella atlantica TaxID=271099 RepID=UPI0026202473|nr:pleiotropic regulatory protein RsmS [uncultured Shewanella sp.]
MSKEENAGKSSGSSIDDAPVDVQLAVDLIYLFESNDIDPRLALSALEMVKSDLIAKLAVSE